MILLLRRPNRDDPLSLELREPVLPVHRPPSVVVGLPSSEVGDRVFEPEDFDRILWKEIRDCDVSGREEGEGGGFSWREFLGGDPRERERAEADRERLAISAESGSDPLRGFNRGLGAIEGARDVARDGARDGFLLVARLFANELNASGVEKGA